MHRLSWLASAILLGIVAPAIASDATGARAPSPALANVYRQGVDVRAYLVSEKLDGVRALWDGRTLYSRRGNAFAPPPWFVEGWPAVPLDGELWMGRGTFEALSGTVRRRSPDEDAWRRVRYMVFDLPAHPGAFDERRRALEAMLAELAPGAPIAPVRQFEVASHAELMAALDEVVAGGAEGLMLRRRDSRHRSGRSDDLLKLKPHEDAEAVVIGHVPGRGKYRGMLGSLLVETADGRRFRLGTGFSDAERRRPPPVGSSVTYRYRGTTSTGLPRFASFLRLRDDEPER